MTHLLHVNNRFPHGVGKRYAHEKTKSGHVTVNGAVVGSSEALGSGSGSFTTPPRCSPHPARLIVRRCPAHSSFPERALGPRRFWLAPA
jgi:hypothetical protein